MYRHNDHLYYCSMGDEILLFHEETQEYFRLNHTGAAIWKMFNNPKSIDDVVGCLQSDFAVEKHHCENEVSQFVAALLANSFLVPA
jgi:hypothetical protein